MAWAFRVAGRAARRQTSIRTRGATVGGLARFQTSARAVARDARFSAAQGPQQRMAEASAFPETSPEAWEEMFSEWSRSLSRESRYEWGEGAEVDREGAWPRTGGSPSRPLEGLSHLTGTSSTTPIDPHLLVDPDQRDPSTLDPEFILQRRAELYRRQLELEEEAVQNTVDKYREICEKVVQMRKGSSLLPAQKLLVRWFQPLVQAIDREQSEILSRKAKLDRARYGPYLILLPPEKLAVIALHETLSTVLHADGRAKMLAVAKSIGDKVEAEVNLMKLKELDRKSWERLQGPMSGKKMQRLRRVATGALDDPEWNENIRIKLGMALLNHLTEVCTLRVTRTVVPAIAAQLRNSFWPERAAPAGEERILEAFDRIADTYARENPASVWLEGYSSEEGDESRTTRIRPREATGEEVAETDPGAEEGDDISVEDDGFVPPEKLAAQKAKRGSAAVPFTPSEMRLIRAVVAAVGGEEEKAALKELMARKEREVEDAKEGEEDVLPDQFDEGSSDKNHVLLPGFLHSYKRVRGRIYGEVRVNPLVPHLLEDAIEQYAYPKHYPMLTPPRPWTRPDTGGYLRAKVNIMRVRGSRQQQESLRLAHMPHVYAGLNVLGQVPWRINQFVHDVVLRVWEEGGGLADIPTRTDAEHDPAPDVSGLEKAEARREMGKWHRQQQRIRQRNHDLTSLRADLMLKLRVAEIFREEVLYFPHNLDFRGRAYPVPPHLNHMGADICRGLLTFAEAKPLGVRGLRWLKVHLANLFGVDKVSFDDRVRFTEENMDKVLDTADRPLDGDRWWLEADAPWQALAACRELANAARSGDPEGYSTRLAVHMDGSCNGLQHYAALGRDVDGARAVNLVRADKPQDVYSEVLKLVLERIDQDREAPQPPDEAGEDAFKEWDSAKKAASFVHGEVNRKVVKQTVMTSVYGVTFIGARDQIRNRLKERFEGVEMDPDAREAAINGASAYLARVTLESLGRMFEKADQIKEWLTTIARLSATQNQPTAWVTPLGLPVVQPYRKQHSMVIRTVLQDVVISDNNDQLPVSGQKQGSAFPPNFVHSLDSTHMLLTAIDCTRKGIRFGAVHDSFWTHPCDVDVMNESIREQFVQLYNMPLLEQLRDSLAMRFPAVSYPPVPERGSLDLTVVKDSPYFFC